MSAMDGVEPAPVTNDAASTGDQPPAEPVPRKSYRRKYRKIMVRFQQKMEESNTLFRDEQKVLDISQRLAEQTDQLLDLLAELNMLPQIPKSLRFDLTSKNDTDVSQANVENEIEDEKSGHIALRRGRYLLQTGQLGDSEYEDLKASILGSWPFAAKRCYTDLLRLPLVQSRKLAEPGHEGKLGTNPYLSVKQEEQYLQTLDAYLDGKAIQPRRHSTRTLANKATDKPAERDRDLQMLNPVSVYNWLRKHEPKVFLQDGDPGVDRASRTAASRTSKRNPARESIIKQEQDLYDEDGIAIDAGTASRNKRKRDEDRGYRPKGGNSRPAKKKKEDGALPAGKKAKKLSIDARNS